MRRVKKIHWYAPRQTLSVQVAGASGRSDRVASIGGRRQALAINPADSAARYMLANDPYLSGQREEAVSEWEQVAASASAVWSEAARKALTLFGRRSDEMNGPE